MIEQTAGEMALPPLMTRQTPRHGFQGDRAVRPETALVPPALSVAISREAGSRGTSIAKRAGKLLGWEVYDQGLIEYVAHEVTFRQRVLEGLAPESAAWVERRLQALWREPHDTRDQSVFEMARLVLALGVQGEVILVGRGAGCILLADSTLHVRLTAPLEDRVAYMSQWLRMTIEEAAQQVAERDRRRAEFLETHFQRRPTDVYQYDLVLNTHLLGEELCAELIAQAAHSKMANRTYKHETRDS
jgi:cytidylate kinase